MRLVDIEIPSAIPEDEIIVLNQFINFANTALKSKPRDIHGIKVRFFEGESFEPNRVILDV